MVLGVGKTSLCASLKANRAGFANNHPSYPGENLEHTEFMAMWQIEMTHQGLLKKIGEFKSNTFSTPSYQLFEISEDFYYLPQSYQH